MKNLLARSLRSLIRHVTCICTSKLYTICSRIMCVTCPPTSHDNTPLILILNLTLSAHAHHAAQNKVCSTSYKWLPPRRTASMMTTSKITSTRTLTSTGKPTRRLRLNKESPADQPAEKNGDVHVKVDVENTAESSKNETDDVDAQDTRCWCRWQEQRTGRRSREEEWDCSYSHHRGR